MLKRTFKCYEKFKLALRARTQVIRDVKDHFVESQGCPGNADDNKLPETAFASMENVSAAMDSRVIVVRRVRSQHR